MTLKAPYDNLQIKPGEHPTPQRMAELMEGIQANFDELFQLFPVQDSNLANGAVASGFIRGQVKGTTGAIIAGSGFTSKRAAEGNYVITLENELSTLGVLLAFVDGGIGWARGVSGKKEFKVETINPTTLGFLDQNFNFIIVRS